MHLIVDELLTKEQLESPKRYIYQMCEMYGWNEPETISSTLTAITVRFAERNEGRARIRRRLIIDGCRRLGTMPQSFSLSDDCCIVTIPKYIK